MEALHVFPSHRMSFRFFWPGPLLQHPGADRGNNHAATAGAGRSRIGVHGVAIGGRESHGRGIPRPLLRPGPMDGGDGQFRFQAKHVSGCEVRLEWGSRWASNSSWAVLEMPLLPGAKSETSISLDSPVDLKKAFKGTESACIPWIGSKSERLRWPQRTSRRKRAPRTSWISWRTPWNARGRRCWARPRGRRCCSSSTTSTCPCRLAICARKNRSNGLGSRSSVPSRPSSCSDRSAGPREHLSTAFPYRKTSSSHPKRVSEVTRVSGYLIRECQVIDYRGFYDRKKLFWKVRRGEVKRC